MSRRDCHTPLHSISTISHRPPSTALNPTFRTAMDALLTRPLDAGMAAHFRIRRSSNSLSRTFRAIDALLPRPTEDVMAERFRAATEAVVTEVRGRGWLSYPGLSFYLHTAFSSALGAKGRSANRAHR